jgi:pimeloyl-ACP methyl ester carboxylesterase
VVVALIILGVLVALALVQALCAWRDRRRFPPSGTMVNGLHVLNLGSGSPAVVFESGLANSSLSWNLIQPEVAKFAATYSYDRAGFGWSHAANAPCSLDRITADLRALLDQQQVPRPFIMVGHSLGGLIARFYAQRFPRELCGLVLIDPATPEEWMNPDRQQRFRLRRAIFFTRAAGVLASIGMVRLGLWLLMLKKGDAPGPISRFSSTLRRIRFELRKLPASVLPRICAHWSRPGFYWTMADYIQALPACAASCATTSLPADLPVVVLSGAHQPRERLAEHAAMASTHMIARGSGHFIHLDEPELVVDAVRMAMTSSKTSPQLHGATESHGEEFGRENKNQNQNRNLTTEDAEERRGHGGMLRIGRSDKNR